MTRTKKVILAFLAILVLSLPFSACSAKDANPQTIFPSITNELVDFC